MAQSESNERRWVWFLCLLAAIHVLIFSAAFPFFNNVDESNHFDLVMKYAHGQPPQSMGLISADAMKYIAIYGSPEFLWPTNFSPNGHYPPPPWTQSAGEIHRYLEANELNRQTVINYEDSQAPLYYVLAGCWWQIGRVSGFEGGGLLYWIRFLNIFLMAAFVWAGYAAAKRIFPEQIFLRLGVPALLAFMPQTTFYSVENDVLSPLCFGLAFIGLLRLLQEEKPTAALGFTTGLALAATYLTKVSNLALLLFAAAVVLLKAWRLLKAGQLRAALPALASLILSAGLPVVGWMIWAKHAFGDFTGSSAKINILGWTEKPFVEWWRHPIFTPHGSWTFLSGLATTLWQGEFLWHQKPLNFVRVNWIYAIMTVVLVGAGLLNLVRSSALHGWSQRWESLWFCLGALGAAVGFLAFLSIIYDFHDCFYPSREHPYFTSGRLMLGALIPFMLFFVYGLDCVLRRLNDRVKFSVLAGLILFMLVSEIATDWPVFSSPYNWFHM
jgi:hypothetical protein